MQGGHPVTWPLLMLSSTSKNVLQRSEADRYNVHWLTPPYPTWGSRHSLVPHPTHHVEVLIARYPILSSRGKSPLPGTQPYPPWGSLHCWVRHLTHYVKVFIAGYVTISTIGKSPLPCTPPYPLWRSIHVWVPHFTHQGKVSIAGHPILPTMGKSPLPCTPCIHHGEISFAGYQWEARFTFL